MAANFRYFMRGAGERAAAGDSVVAAQRSVRLKPYDRLLRQFKCAAHPACVWGCVRMHLRVHVQERESEKEGGRRGERGKQRGEREGERGEHEPAGK